MKSSEKAYDDLTAITGIGPARQRWLRESFNVRTFQDLADLSVDQIESRLKADGQIPSRSAIVTWLLQAQEFAARVSQSAEPDLGTIDVRTAVEGNALTRENGWRPFASFVVEFQTRESPPEGRRTAVHHMENDTGTYWSGIESKQLCRWMLEQIGEHAEPEELELGSVELADTGPTKEESARLEVTQVRLFQPPQADTATGVFEANQPFQGTVEGSTPFALEVSFGLSGAARADIAAQQAPYFVQSYAYDRAADTSIHLCETEPISLEEGRYAYTLMLPEASLQRGTYRLWVIAALPDAAAVPDYIEVPMLQVT